MNNKRLAELLLVSIVILTAAPTTFALPAYLTNLTEIYGAGSCDTCHINGSSAGPRTGYGTLFENQVDHLTNASAALIAIGAPPTATITPTITMTLTATPEETTEPGIIEETIEPGITEEIIETTPEVTTVTATTPGAPGFGIVVSIVGLFAWAILERRKNK